jgi:hypothetical protein
MAAEDKVKINLNQNLWCLIVALAALWVAWRWDIHRLLRPAYVFTLSTGALVLISCLFYTLHYCTKKYWDFRYEMANKGKRPSKSGGAGQI